MKTYHADQDTLYCLDYRIEEDKYTSRCGIGVLSVGDLEVPAYEYNSVVPVDAGVHMSKHLLDISARDLIRYNTLP